MVRWRRFLVPAIPALVLFLLIPFGVVVTAFSLGSSQTINAIFSLILLLQLYVIVAQAEIAMRQNKLLSAQYEPSLMVSTEMEIGTAGSISVKVHNAGSQPAYNVFFGALNEHTGQKLHIEQVKRDLSPHEKVTVLSIPILEYQRTPIRLNATYTNVLGDLNQITFVKGVGREFMTIMGVSMTSGFLLSSLEYLIWPFKLARAERKIAKSTSIKSGQ